MSTITATSDATKSQVRLDLDFSDIDAPYVLVQRIDPTTGAPTTVRGHGSSTTIGGVAYAPMQAGFKAVLYDTEMPLDHAFYYTATAPSVVLNATPTFSGGYFDPWYLTIPSAMQVQVTANRAGAFFMSFHGDGATATPLMRGDDIPATPGATFTVTVTMSANASVATAIGFSWKDSTGAIISQGNTATTVLSSTTATFTATVPANTAYVQPFIGMTGTPPATTILSVASVTLTNAAGSATSSSVSVPSLSACRLKDPLRPGLNVRVDFSFDPGPLCSPGEGVFFQSIDVESRAANSAAFNVNNQSTPVVVSKQRSAVTSTLTLVSRTFADEDRLNEILLSGSPLQFQVPAEYGVKDRMLAIGGTTVSRVLPDHRFPIRVFGLPFSHCAAPGGPMQGAIGTRWQDMCNKYANWGAINGAGLTWTQLLDGAAG